MTPGKEDKKPEEMIPGKENKKPEEMTPGKENKKPEEMAPGKEDKKPEEMTPGKEDKKPEEMTPGKEDKKPEEMTPGKENKKPEEMTPGKENKKPEEMTPGKEDKEPEEMAPGKENKKPEEMTPGKEDKKPEGMTPGKEDKKPEGMTPDAGNKPDAGKKEEENFNKLKEEALKNINSDDKLTPKEKKDFSLLVEKSSAATTFVTKLSDGGEVKVQFDNKNINAKNIKSQLSDVATSEKVRELAKQQLGDKFNVVKTIDLDFVYEKGNIEKKQGDTRTVTVTIGTNSGNEFEVYHLNGNMLEKVPSIYKNGKITFFTNHFSTYTILAKLKEQQNNNSNGKKDNNNNNVKKDNSNGKKDKVNKVDKTLPNTGMTISSTIALGLTLMALAILVIRRKFSK